MAKLTRCRRGGGQPPQETNLILLYSPPPDTKPSKPIASVWWDKNKKYFVDDTGHRFNFKFEDGRLRLFLVDEGGRSTEDYYAEAIPREFDGRTFKTLSDDTQIVGKIVRAEDVGKRANYIDPRYQARSYLKPPLPEHKGRWVLPAYIAYFKHKGAEAVIQLPAAELEAYYTELGFGETIADKTKYFKLDLTDTQ